MVINYNSQMAKLSLLLKSYSNFQYPKVKGLYCDAQIQVAAGKHLCGSQNYHLQNFANMNFENSKTFDNSLSTQN